MIKKPTLTYIKNGEEKTVNLNIFNESRVLEKIFDITYLEYADMFLYKLKDDIELIHLKNYKFRHNLKLENNSIFSSEENILILEDCEFKGNSLKIETDNLEMINPNFLPQSRLDINNTISVNLKLNETSNNLDIRIRECNQVSLNLFSSLNLLQVYDTENIHIKNLTSIKDKISSYIFSKNLTLENSHPKEMDVNCQTITLKNSTLENNRDNAFIQSLSLLNSKVKSDKELEFPNLIRLEFNDNSSYLEANTLIKIGKKEFKNPYSDKLLKIDCIGLKENRELVKQNLLFALHEIRNKINSSVVKNYSKEEQPLLKEIDSYQRDKLEELNKEFTEQEQKLLLEKQAKQESLDIEFEQKKKELDLKLKEKRKQFTKELSAKKEQNDNKLEEVKKHILSKKITEYIKK